MLNLRLCLSFSLVLTISVFATELSQAQELAPRLKTAITPSANQVNDPYSAGSWSGYVIPTGANQLPTLVAATWTVPVAYYQSYGSSTPPVEYSATFIGIGGGPPNNDGNLIQIGTEQDVNSSGGTAYYAWYEVTLPGVVSYQTPLSGAQYPVSAGDVITAQLACIGTCVAGQQQSWLFSMSNSTKNWSWSTTLPFASTLSTAEWIYATSTVNGALSPLPNYGSVLFSNTSLNGVTINLNTFGVTMNDPNGGISTPCNSIEGGNFVIIGTNIFACQHFLFAQQGNKLFDPSNSPNSLEGWSVAASADGNTVVVGGFGADSGAGVAWIYVGNEGVWSLQQKIVPPPDEIGAAGLGSSVAISADGNTVLLGGSNDNSGAGAAWVYVRNGISWTEQQKLYGTLSVSGKALQGTSVALSADGNTALVGGENDNGAIGAAWVFTRTGTNWSQVGPKLVANNHIGIAAFGASVALSGDGTIALVGGPYDNNDTGAVWAFAKIGNAWSQQQKFGGSGAAGPANFGTSVALSADGTTAIVGGPTDNNGTGAAWIFVQSQPRPTLTFSQSTGKLIGAGASSGPTVLFGSSVALDAHGTVALVGGVYDNNQAGAAWVFAQLDSFWAQQGLKRVGKGASGSAGQGRVALSADMSTAIIGGSDDDSSAGAFWVFTGPFSDAPHVDYINPTNGPAAGGTAVVITGTNLTGVTGVNFGSVPAASFSVVTVGMINATSPPGFGTVDVTVTSISGISATGPGDQFTYLATPHDMNRDGKSDLVWRDTSGNTALWLMKGGLVLSSQTLGAIPAAWSIVGQRDFNGDGIADLLWHDTNGNTAVWLFTSEVIIPLGLGNIPTSWSIVGTGDFNGDGIGDILWEDSSGNVVVWLMNGTTVTSSGFLGNVPPATWSLAGTGDFDGDGKYDLLWRDTGGNTAIWFVNGTTVSSGASVGNAPTNWSIVGTGDFNGDGMTDIVWRDTAGDAAIWLMNGATISSASSIGTIPTSWSIVQTGDYNGDGKSDLLWRDNLGNTAMWFMNGANVASTTGVGIVPTTWTVQSANAE